MTLAMAESVFSKLATDSESLTLSESCVKSDIANIIRKIYSPRPLMADDIAVGSAVESRDNVGDRISVSRPKAKEEKRFGFYFEPVTGYFAKTLVDSSTTSGSVSVPIVRYKPKRLRNVCECCKRRITHHVHETRRKPTCRDCKICKRNECSDAENSSIIGGFRKQVNRNVNNCKVSNYEVVRVNSGVSPTVHNSKVRVSNYEVVQVNPGVSFKMLDRTQRSTNLERKQSLMDVTRNRSENVLKTDNNIQCRLDCGSVLNLQIVPDLTNNSEINKTEKSTPKTKNVEVKNVSFLQRIMCTIFGKNNRTLLEEEVRSRKIENLDHVHKKSSKTSMGSKKAEKQRRNKHKSEKLGHVDFSVVPEDSRYRGLRSKEEMQKSVDISSEQNQIKDQTITSETCDLEKVTIDYPEKIPSKHKIEKPTSDKDGKHQGLQMCDEDVEQNPNNELENGDHDHVSGKRQDKYQVAYKSLRIEVESEWAYEFWAGVFKTCHTVTTFVTAFVLHLLTFVLQSLVQPLICGTARISSEHFFKPCLSTAFEGVIQPVCILIERLASSLRDVCLPVAQCFGVFCKEISHVCRACRIVEIHKNYHFNDDLKNP